MTRTVLFLLLTSWTLNARADFSDALPAPQPKPPAPEAQPAPAAAPLAATPSATAAPKVPTPKNPVPSPAVKPATTEAPRPATPPPAPRASSGGDFLSGNFFSDVKHDTSAPVELRNAAELTGSLEKGGVLSGNVVVVQGDLEMRADTVNGMLNAERKLDRIVARGKVHVTKPVAPGATEAIEAWAQEMEYSMASGKMILRKKAKVTRGRDCNLQGDALEYDLTTGSVGGRQVRGACLPPKNQDAKP